MKKIFSTLILAITSLVSFSQTQELLPVGNPSTLLVEAESNMGAASSRPNNFSYTVPAGNSRALVVIYRGQSNGNSADYPTAITYGGQAMTQATQYIVQQGSTSKFLNVYVFYLTESDINAATSNTFNVTYFRTSPGHKASYAFEVLTADDINQNSPMSFCASYQTGGNIDDNDSLSCQTSITAPQGSLLLNIGAIGKWKNVAPVGSNPGFTQLRSQKSNNFWLATFYHTVDTTSLTFAPYMTTDKNAGRFVFLAVRFNTTAVSLNLESTVLSAKNSGKTNILTWNNSGRDVMYYTLQSSPDGIRFSAVAMMKPVAQGTYSFNDADGASKNFYRVVVVGLDGTEKYSNTVVVNRQWVTEQSVYPNPSTGTFRIGSVLNSPTNVIIYNSIGQSVGFNLSGQEVKLINPVPGTYRLRYGSNGSSYNEAIQIK